MRNSLVAAYPWNVLSAESLTVSLRVRGGDNNNTSLEYNVVRSVS